MQWSKLKRTAEGMLAESFCGRIAYHVTRYGPGESEIMTRGWITFDQHEIASFSTIRRIRTSYRLAGRWHSRDPQIQDMPDQAGLFTHHEFVTALETVVQLPIKECVHATMPIIRAVALFDHRFGKRQLRTLTLTPQEHSLVIRCYQIRREVEGTAIEHTGT